MKLKIEDTVFVFDLDDTLYSEMDYFKSGLRAVNNVIKEVTNEDASPIIEALLKLDEKDLWGAVCQSLGLPDSVKESLLWEYRLHVPEISLDEEVSGFLNYLKCYSLGVAIITDGRIVTQKKKLLALGLSDIPVLISEAYSSEKPESKRFEILMKQYGPKHYVYIGDNPKKDFYAPNKLDWITIGIRSRGRNIHSQDLTELPLPYHPKYWLTQITDLRELLC